MKNGQFLNRKPLKILAFIICGLTWLTLSQPAFADKLNIYAKQIDFSSIHPTQKKYDKLYWRGGLVLSSAYKRFGGLSGIELSKDGKKLLAVSDRGYWLKANVDYKSGRLSGLSHAQMAPILNSKGRKFRPWEIDSEGLTKRNDSLDDVVISVEHDQAIYRYKLGKNSLGAKAKEWGALADAKKISRNRGLEGITSLPKGHKYRGWMLATAERKLDKNGNHSAWLVNGKQNHAFSIKKHGIFDITDVSYLPNGDIVILERAISVFSGPRMQIRQICGAEIKPGALVDGEKLLNANWVLAVDNMEGLAVHKAANGETILTVVSDNNFHFLQRNLLLQFALVSNASVCS